MYANITSQPTLPDITPPMLRLLSQVCGQCVVSEIHSCLCSLCTGLVFATSAHELAFHLPVVGRVSLDVPVLSNRRNCKAAGEISLPHRTYERLVSDNTGDGVACYRTQLPHSIVGTDFIVRSKKRFVNKYLHLSKDNI